MAYRDEHQDPIQELHNRLATVENDVDELGGNLGKLAGRVIVNKVSSVVKWFSGTMVALGVIGAISYGIILGAKGCAVDDAAEEAEALARCSRACEAVELEAFDYVERTSYVEEKCTCVGHGRMGSFRKDYTEFSWSFGSRIDPPFQLQERQLGPFEDIQDAEAE